MTYKVPVRAGESQFFIELVEPPEPEAVEGLGVPDFGDIVTILRDIGGSLARAWEVIEPSEAVVDITLEAEVKEGKLSGLLVSGGAKGSLAVSLTWKFD